jgi:hypothetical protein
MSVNKNRPHLMVLPEDDANRKLANGFHLQVDWNRYRQMQVLPPADGWNNVLNLFRSDHVREMERWPQRFMILLIDFDNHNDRLTDAKAAIPEHLAERVFVLGVWSEPQRLKLGPYETVGAAMARDCREETNKTWGHELLRHNTGEIERLRERVRPILFEAV